MRQDSDTKTMDLLAGVVHKIEPGPRRGRPPTGNAKTAAERKRAQRARLLDERGLVPRTYNLPLDLVARLEEFMAHKDVTADQVVEKFLRNALRKR